MTHTGTQRTRRNRPYDDSPDTAAAFRRIASLPEGPQRAALRQEVVCAWIPMAARLAQRFSNGREPLEDLRQVAQVGLVKAVSRFDPDVGTAFEAFAIPTIVGEVKRHFRDNLWAVHVPRRVQELRLQVRAADRELCPSRGTGGPTAAEIAAATGLTEQEVRRGQGALHSWSTLSIEAAHGHHEDAYPLAETLGCSDPAFDRIVDRETLRPLLRALPERDRRILYLRFFREMDQSGIGEELGMSQMHVSRLIRRICESLRDQAMSDAA
ncbi:MULTISPECIES: SigB/SigF/SigG family RNA polymerase sigma factor [unclassified Streptomyces]|uniref:SigB/SigF/SigG family RNA polymerase sigma factor n=1 Tax=unclassified Streptomyces TaxID=2593676 RepID=UPI000DC784EB|nr:MULTISPECIES: SigB/SigF/SigG family RNA polymerase sigma factor [unclassified Streptomyces]AWZ03339.1 B/F/G family RNA polymerase sigma-70 factor [Streptomyces sp. ICC4]AWZ11121.1 B/F/G family RNA polymerase sigma-70 factor [Streptomyces sp. ICC1]